MKICAAQTRPIKGDIQGNIKNHKKFIDSAVSHKANIIIFPELSLTGYEPTLAKDLATHQDDSRLDVFQTLSNANEITIGVGVPTKNGAGICISMVLFQPHKARQTYSKKYLHADEEEFFVSGENITGLKVGTTQVGLAICYELSVPEHAEAAYNGGAEIYVASVAKFVNGIEKATKRLSEIARTYSMPVVMSNCVGFCDGAECAGRTAVWNKNGLLIGQLDGTNEGILIYDTDTHEVIKR
jgi:predicted amidohydrolase